MSQSADETGRQSQGPSLKYRFLRLLCVTFWARAKRQHDDERPQHETDRPAGTCSPAARWTGALEVHGLLPVHEAVAAGWPSPLQHLKPLRHWLSLAAD